MKIRTVNDLSDHLDLEFSWRLKELADMKLLVKSTTDLKQLSMIRAGIPLTYAHWEGFIKASAQYYLNFVLTQKQELKRLQPCFIALSAQRLISNFSVSNRISQKLELVNFLLSERTLNSPAQYSTSINTKANLNSIVFNDISLSIGIDSKNYETKFKFIDESLLRRRNEIAHGSFLDLDAASFRDIVDEVIGLMRHFNNDVLNNALLKKYLS